MSFPPEYETIRCVQALAAVVKPGVLPLSSVDVPLDIVSMREEVPGLVAVTAFGDDPPYENRVRVVAALLASFIQNEMVCAADPVTAVIEALATTYDEPSRLRTLPYDASIDVTGVPDPVLSPYVPVSSVPYVLP